MAEQKPAGEEDENRVFDQFMANEHFAAATAAIEFNGAKGQLFGGGNLKRAVRDGEREWHEHCHEHESRTAHADTRQQQQPAKYFEPGQGGRD